MFSLLKIYKIWSGYELIAYKLNIAYKFYIVTDKFG